MIIVFAGSISLIGGAFTARYLKQRTGWVALHKKLALAGVLIVLAGIFVAAYMVSIYMETSFVREMHAYLGASVFILLIVTPLLGIFQFRLKDKRMHTIHRWSGRITIMFILFAIIAGIQMALTVLAQNAEKGM
jgi:nitrogen fixation/metabolism regulation signal transduction histidine kinase